VSGVHRLELRGVRKRYDATLALRDVDLEVDAGEVHALAGENGAGKSTLIKILAGAVRRDEGTIALDGTPVELQTPLAARAAGIRVVYQELSLVPTVSVTENVLLGQMPAGARGMWIDWTDAHRRAAEAIASMGFEVPDVRRRVGTLPLSQRQMIEIAKALLARPRILILDEPSAVLSTRDLERLFAAIRSLRQSGGTVIYVSHRLDEVFAIADRITVLKDGARVGTLPASQVDQQGLVRMMVGRSLGEIFPAHRPPASPAPVLVVRGLGRRRAFRDVSLELSPGEIVGVSGLVGSGRSEMIRAIAGADRPEAGEMALAGRPYHPRSPAEGLRAGVAMLSEDRARDGLIPDMSLRDNLSLASFARISRWGILRRRVQLALVKEEVRELNVRAASVEDPVRRLSGGNQQKAMVGRWLLRGARVLLLDEPTRGVDVGAKAEIYRIVAGLAERGMAVLLVSSELPEVLGMSDRILVMRGGRIVARFQRGEATEERLLAAAAGVAPEAA
jgi:ABC-type sugar transport system ATPase subunit